jgi:hypothetical protein
MEKFKPLQILIYYINSLILNILMIIEKTIVKIKLENETNETEYSKYY